MNTNKCRNLETQIEMQEAIFKLSYKPIIISSNPYLNYNIHHSLVTNLKDYRSTKDALTKKMNNVSTLGPLLPNLYIGSVRAISP